MRSRSVKDETKSSEISREQKSREEVRKNGLCKAVIVAITGIDIALSQNQALICLGIVRCDVI